MNDNSFDSRKIALLPKIVVCEQLGSKAFLF